MSISDKYKELESQLAQYFKEQGFEKHRSNYLLRNGECNGVINIQKSKVSTKELIKFTYNIGVYSTVLANFYNGFVKEDIAIDDCHWIKRIGLFNNGNKDLWFEINTQITMDSLVKSLKYIFSKNVLPELKEILKANGLLATWVENKNTNVTEFERLLNLTVLMTKANHPDKEKAMSELMAYAKSRKISIELHLQKLNGVI
ncbi:MAG: DUF4304 domain-containing protein [Saprospiraceae bacterium]|nr:DUF4304 domain-containing protein [Saprospiraceae bacterium]